MKKENKNMKHTNQWFRNRIGKTIYRKPLEGKCKCVICKSTKIIIHNGSKHGNKYIHANYLFLVQNEMGIEYYDKKIRFT